MHIKNIQNMLIFLVGRISFEFSCVVSLPDFSLPAAADLPGVVDEHASLLHLYQRRRQRCFCQSVQEVLMAIFEGVAPALSSPILNTLTFSVAVLFRGP